MKKSLLAVAVLATFASAASAQSSVTLYGRVDTFVSYTKPGNGVGNGDEIWRLNDGGDNGGWAGSRWGLRGSEDLGSGLKANFVLESGFRTDTGDAAASGVTFNRMAWVGLSSTSLGEVRLGRQETISRLINSGYSDVSGISELKIDEAVGGGRQLFQTFGQRQNNVVNYLTPIFGGFQASAQVGAGEGANARYQGVMASYTGGPLKVAIGYEEFDKFGAAGGTFQNVYNIGANFNAGFATFFAGGQYVKDPGSQTTGVITLKEEKAGTIGVMVPVGALQIRANYTYAKYELYTGASRDADQQKYGISVRYALSKRTSLYSAYNERDGENPGGVDASRLFTQKRELTLLGVDHAF